MRAQMKNLEEQADNAKARELFWKPLAQENIFFTAVVFYRLFAAP